MTRQPQPGDVFWMRNGGEAVFEGRVSEPGLVWPVIARTLFDGVQRQYRDDGRWGFGGVSDSYDLVDFPDRPIRTIAESNQDETEPAELIQMGGEVETKEKGRIHASGKGLE